MANTTKRNFIRLIEDMNGDEAVYKTYVTPAFIPFKKIYQSIEAEAEFKKAQDPDTEVSEKEALDSMIDTVVDIYDGQFTRDDLITKMHAPDFVQEMQDQIAFVGSGKQDEKRKKELAKIIS